MTDDEYKAAYERYLAQMTEARDRYLFLSGSTWRKTTNIGPTPIQAVIEYDYVQGQPPPQIIYRVEPEKPKSAAVPVLGAKRAYFND